MNAPIGGISPLNFQWTIGDSKASKPEDVAAVAEQFESLLLGMLLRSMREASSGSGWLGCDNESSLSPIAELAEQQVAQTLSAGGGLGLARLLRRNLVNDAAPVAIPATDHYARQLSPAIGLS